MTYPYSTFVEFAAFISVLMLAIVINKRKKKIKQKRESDKNRAEQILQVPMT